jgi:hypothetical protein
MRIESEPQTNPSKALSAFLSADAFKARFKLTLPQNLFGYDWKLMARGCCPICACRLYEMRKRPDTLICRSRKHKRSFVIGRAKLSHIVEKLSARDNSETNRGAVSA